MSRHNVSQRDNKSRCTRGLARSNKAICEAKLSARVGRFVVSISNRDTQGIQMGCDAAMHDCSAS
jgi:hypothetical protein